MNMYPEMGSIQGGAEDYDKDIHYVYPRDADLKPTSDTHRQLVAHLLSEIRPSFDQQKQHYSGWQEMDEMLTMYIPVPEEQLKAKNRNSTEPIRVVVPYMYTARETILTFMMNVFVNSPIFRYPGVGPEDVLGALMLEKVVDQQAKRHSAALKLMAAISDGITYGRGASHVEWHKTMGKSIRRRFKSQLMERMMNGIPVPARVKSYLNERILVDTVTDESSRITSINPYAYFPSRNAVAGSVHLGSCVAFGDRTTKRQLKQREAAEPTRFFNARYLDKFKSNIKSAFLNAEATKNLDKSGSTREPDTDSVDFLFVECLLVPSEFKIGTSKKPERWRFLLAGDEVILHAEPIQGAFDGFDVVECAPDSDARSGNVISRMSTVLGLQKVANFYFNSRVENIRFHLYSGYLVDPMMINMDDLLKPHPGMLVRTTESMWGKGVGDFLTPLPTRDASATQVSEGIELGEMIRNFTGAEASLQGMRRHGGERVTAAEITQTGQGALSRLGRVAAIIDFQYMQPIARLFATNTQQFMSQDTYVKTIGDWDRQLRDDFGIEDDRVKVSPFDLLCNYDVEPSSAISPGAVNLQALQQNFQVLATSPALGAQFDLVNMYRYMARLSGVPNVNDFVRRNPVQAQTMPEEQIQNQVKNGNLVPVSALAGQ